MESLDNRRGIGGVGGKIPKAHRKKNRVGYLARVFWKLRKKEANVSRMDKIKVKIKDLAAFLGISERQAFRLRKEGCFVNDSGYDLQACTQAYIKKLKAKKERPKFEWPKEWGKVPSVSI